MPQVVELPDGLEVEFPDDATPEFISSALRKHFTTPPKSMEDRLAWAKRKALLSPEALSTLTRGPDLLAGTEDIPYPEINLPSDDQKFSSPSTDSGLIPSFQAATTQSALREEAAARTALAPETKQSIAAKAQADLQGARAGQILESLNSDPEYTLTGSPASNADKLDELQRDARVAKVEAAAQPAAEASAEQYKRASALEQAAALRTQATKAYSDLGISPESTNIGAEIGRGLAMAPAIVASRIPYVGPVLMLADMSANAYAQGQAQAAAEGVTDPEELKRAGNQAVIGQAPGLAIYALGGKLGAKLASSIAGEGADVLTKGLSSFAGAQITNVGVGSVLRALEAPEGKRLESALSLEGITADTLLSVVHMAGEFEGSSAKAREAARQELQRRGFTAEQIDKTVPENQPAQVVVKPAEQPVSAPNEANVVQTDSGPQRVETTGETRPLSPVEETSLRSLGAIPEPTAPTDTGLAQLPAREEDAPIVQPTADLTDEQVQEYLPEDASNKMKEVGLSRARMDQWREANGLDELMRPVRQSLGELWDKAVASIGYDPGIVERTEQKFLEGSQKSLTGTDVAILTYKTAERRHLMEKAELESKDYYRQAALTDDAKAKAELLANAEGAKRVSEAEKEKLDEIGHAISRARTTTARGLNSLKILASQSFEPQFLRTRLRIAKGGEKLTPEESKRADMLSSAIADAAKEVEQKTAAADEARSRETARAALDKELSPFSKSSQPAASKSRVLSFLEDAEQRARQRIANRRQGLAADPFLTRPIAQAADDVIIGAAHFARGISSFKAWSAKMIEEFGDSIKPRLKELFASSKQYVKDAAKNAQLSDQYTAVREALTKRAAEGDKVRDVARYVKQLARLHIQAGETDLDKLLHTLHAEVGEHLPGVTRREVMDAFSGYGYPRESTVRSTFAQQAVKLKAQAAKIAKLSDLIGGEKTPKSSAKLAPDKLSEEIKAVQREVGRTPEERAQKSLDATKARLRQQIDDLDFAIANRIPIEGNRAPVSDAEAEFLRRQRDTLKQQYDELFPRTQTEIDAAEVQRRLKSTERAITDIEEKIRSGDIAPKAKLSGPTSPELETARAALGVLRQHLQDLRDADSSLREEKTQKQLQKSIANTEEQIKNGGRSAKDKPKLGPDSQKVAELKKELAAKREQLAEIKRNDQQRILEAEKRRLQRANDELERRIAAREPKSNWTRPKLIQADEELRQAQLWHEQLKDAARKMESELRKDSETKAGKSIDILKKVRRATALIFPTTLIKLPAAALTLMGSSFAEDVIGSLVNIPFRKLADLAPRYGRGFSLSLEAHAITEVVRKFMSDTKSIFKTGKTDLELLFDNKNISIETKREMVELFGRVHQVLKNPLKRYEFSKSFANRMKFYGERGADVTQPEWVARIGAEAYMDAERAIFKNDNPLSRAYQNGLKYFEREWKNPKNSLGWRTLARTADLVSNFAFPLVKIPTNIVLRIFDYTPLAAGIGGIRAVRALREISKGGEVTFEQADAILRQLRSGSIGSAMFLLGYANPKSVGGYYTGKKRQEGEPEFGGAKLGNTNIYRTLLHAPVLEQMQIGATVRRISDSLAHPHDTETQGPVKGAIAGTLGVASELPTFEGAKHLLSLMDLRELDRLYPKLTETMAGGIGWAAKKLDRDAAGNTRQVEDRPFLNAVESVIPGVRNTLPPRTDAFDRMSAAHQQDALNAATADDATILSARAKNPYQKYLPKTRGVHRK